eukprot:g5987.t1
MRKEEETDEKNVIHEEKIEFEDEIPMGYERIDMDYEAVEEEEEEKSTSSFDTSIADAQLRMLEDDYARCLAMSNVSKQASTMTASFESASEQSTSSTTTKSTTKTVTQPNTSPPPLRSIPISKEKADLIRSIMKDINIKRE